MKQDTSEFTPAQKRQITENATVISMTVDEARAFALEIEDDALSLAIDQAQGDVFAGQEPEAFIVLRIVK